MIPSSTLFTFASLAFLTSGAYIPASLDRTASFTETHISYIHASHAPTQHPISEPHVSFLHVSQTQHPIMHASHIEESFSGRPTERPGRKHYFEEEEEEGDPFALTGFLADFPTPTGFREINFPDITGVPIHGGEGRGGNHKSFSEASFSYFSEVPFTRETGHPISEFAPRTTLL